MKKVIQKPVRDLVRQLSREYNLPYKDVLEIVDSQFKFLKHAIGQGTKGEYDTFENVLLRYLGTFEASEGKIHHMSERFNKSNYNGE